MYHAALMLMTAVNWPAGVTAEFSCITAAGTGGLHSQFVMLIIKLSGCAMPPFAVAFTTIVCVPAGGRFVFVKPPVPAWFLPEDRRLPHQHPHPGAVPAGDQRHDDSGGVQRGERLSCARHRPGLLGRGGAGAAGHTDQGGRQERVSLCAS